jgi:hypothetical protein
MRAGVFGGPHVLLARALREGVAPTRLGTFAALFASAMLSLPATLAARLRGRVLPPPPLVHPPLFVLGHYRSGTTLLHKLLAAPAHLGTVDTFDLLFPVAPAAVKRVTLPALQLAVRRLGIRQGFFYDSPLRLDDPNEVEPWLLALGSEWSSYWGYLFPRVGLEYLNRFVGLEDPERRRGWQRAYDQALRRAAARSGGRALVIKDPPNTGRVGALLELWPDARFAHVKRDPADVLRSMRDLWRATILPRFSLQRISHRDVDRIVLGHYEALMGAWLAQRDRIDRGRLVEVGYEDLVADPLNTALRVADSLAVPLDDAGRDAIAIRANRERGYRGRPSAGADDLPPGWQEAAERWRRRLATP